MITRDLVVRCEHGLQLRVATTVAGVAREHRTTTVRLSCGNCRNADACSVLELLTLEAGNGARLELVAEGPDEDAVSASMAGIFEQGAGI